MNVFLAIAVDNLANAQELTAAEEADEKANEIEEESEELDEQYQEGDHCTIDMEGKTAGDMCAVARAMDGSFFKFTAISQKKLHFRFGRRMRRRRVTIWRSKTHGSLQFYVLSLAN